MFLRVLTVIAGLALVGIVLKLIGSILTPILPASFNAALSSGLAHLVTIVSPAIPAIGALAIIALVLWIITGRR
ncbi:hypothetical protein [Catenulispora acidiphila]|uniref:hypothetical protein n=1 Tax=Catenulispora acidiphila TaxID=304895 RepID=UPI00117E3BBA|nr:hypothetical protein [Catenulispora acidiphila]